MIEEKNKRLAELFLGNERNQPEWAGHQVVPKKRSSVYPGLINPCFVNQGYQFQ